MLCSFTFEESKLLKGKSCEYNMFSRHLVEACTLSDEGPTSTETGKFL